MRFEVVTRQAASDLARTGRLLGLGRIGPQLTFGLVALGLLALLVFPADRWRPVVRTAAVSPAPATTSASLTPPVKTPAATTPAPSKAAGRPAVKPEVPAKASAGQGGQKTASASRPASSPPPSQPASSPPASQPAAAPASPPAAPPAAPASTVPNRFAWAPVSGASRYEFALFRGSRQVFGAKAANPTLRVPRKHLKQGTYVWYVWAVRGGKKDAAAVVRASFTVPAP